MNSSEELEDSLLSSNSAALSPVCVATNFQQRSLEEQVLWNRALNKINTVLMTSPRKQGKRQLLEQEHQEPRKNVVLVQTTQHSITEVKREDQNAAYNDKILGSWNPSPIVSLYGESRLRITFLNLGKPGIIKQRFGRGSSLIPDGLTGRHEMYEQQWKFEVFHEIENGKTLIIWKITNVISGTVTAVMETQKQAHIREISGRTICNKVVKTALETRAVELENLLAQGLPEQKSKRAAVKNLITILRPKMCTVGLLFFGLLHEAVQSRFIKE